MSGEGFFPTSQAPNPIGAPKLPSVLSLRVSCCLSTSHPTKPPTSCELARLTGGLGYSRKSVCGNSCQAGKSSVHGRH